jgi:hypothetical protein
MNGDAQLRDLFGQARSQEVAGAPGFAPLLARHRGPNVVGSCAALILLVLAAFTTFSVSEPPAPAVSISEWRSPTAFLLHTTDEALWRGLPSLGPSYEEETP